MQGLGGNDTYYVDWRRHRHEAVGWRDRHGVHVVSYALLGGQEIENLRTNNQAAVVAIT